MAQFTIFRLRQGWIRVLLTGLVLITLTACQGPRLVPGMSDSPVIDRSKLSESIATRQGLLGRFASFNETIQFDFLSPEMVLVIPAQPIIRPLTGNNVDNAHAQSGEASQAGAVGPDREQEQKTTELAKAAPELMPKLASDWVIRGADNMDYCRRIDRKLSSVSFRICLLEKLRDSEFRTTENNPIYYVNFASDQSKNPLGKVLVLGGVHGDELTSVSIVYLWIKTLNRFHSGLFDWRVVPVVNPDGFFRDRPSRTNANGIDLNRNLPTYQWNQLASRYWNKRTHAAQRKFPGYQAASEAETRWLVNEIEEYQPDVIVTVHAPYNLVDFDAVDRTSAPRRLGILRGKSLGTFPGSLGRYAGEERNIPVITLELPHSTRMPSTRAVNGIWLDLVSWLRQNINSQNIAGRTFNHCSGSLSAAGCI